MEATRILVPVNGDPATERTFRWACRLAKQNKAELHAVHVIEVPLDLPLEAEMGPEISKGERVLGRIETIGGEEKFKPIQAKFLRARRAGPALVQETEDRHFDMIVLGIPFRRRFGTCHLGSTASYIFNNATCRVIFLRDQAGIAYFD
jgi:nucleotide-binding universal stress UspA family protein